MDTKTKRQLVGGVSAVAFSAVLGLSVFGAQSVLAAAPVPTVPDASTGVKHLAQPGEKLNPDGKNVITIEKGTYELGTPLSAIQVLYKYPVSPFKGAEVRHEAFVVDAGEHVLPLFKKVNDVKVKDGYYTLRWTVKGQFLPLSSDNDILTKDTKVVGKWVKVGSSKPLTSYTVHIKLPGLDKTMIVDEGTTLDDVISMLKEQGLIPKDAHYTFATSSSDSLKPSSKVKNNQTITAKPAPAKPGKAASAAPSASKPAAQPGKAASAPAAKVAPAKPAKKPAKSALPKTADASSLVGVVTAGLTSVVSIAGAFVLRKR